MLVITLALMLGIPLVLGHELEMVKVIGGEMGVEGEPNKPEEDLECGLGGGLTRILHEGVSLPTRN